MSDPLGHVEADAHQESVIGSDPIAPLRAALKGRYEIQRQIGQGAFATVYLARDIRRDDPRFGQLLSKLHLI